MKQQHDAPRHATQDRDETRSRDVRGVSAGSVGHTPGPWKVVHDLRQYTEDNGELQLVGYNIEGADGEEVVGMEGIEAWKDNAEANARLIAAAPDLLEALQGLLAIVADSRGVAGYHLNGKTAEWGEFDEVDAARAAIAKATWSAP